MVNFIQVGKGIYFYCTDCAEKYSLNGVVIDYRKNKEGSIQKIQCFACGKHTSIFIQDKKEIRDFKHAVYGKQKDGTWTEPNANDQPIGDGVADWWLDFNKIPTFQAVSTRPACPMCKMGTLTGYLTNTMQSHVEYSTVCENPECHCTVFLDTAGKVSHARTRDGGLLMYTGG